MGKSRLEAFSDGVLAVLITVLVLELHPPNPSSFAGLLPLLPAFLSFLLSFIVIAIHWINHHHMLETVTRVTAGMLWANVNWLLWLALIPFSAAWLNASGFDTPSVVIYGVVLFLAGTAYFILQTVIIASQGPASKLKAAIGADLKGKGAPIVLLLGIGIAFWQPWVGAAVYALVGLIWLVPNRATESPAAEHNRAD